MLSILMSIISIVMIMIGLVVIWHSLDMCCNLFIRLGLKLMAVDLILQAITIMVGTYDLTLYSHIDELRLRGITLLVFTIGIIISYRQNKSR